MDKWDLVIALIRRLEKDGHDVKSILLMIQAVILAWLDAEEAEGR